MHFLSTNDKALTDKNTEDLPDKKLCNVSSVILRLFNSFTHLLGVKLQSVGCVISKCIPVHFFFFCFKLEDDIQPKFCEQQFVPYSTGSKQMFPCKAIG
jgi:hypothetical protein